MDSSIDLGLRVKPFGQHGEVIEAFVLQNRRKRESAKIYIEYNILGYFNPILGYVGSKWSFWLLLPASCLAIAGSSIFRRVEVSKGCLSAVL